MSQVIHFLLWSGSLGPPVAGLAKGTEGPGTDKNGLGASCYSSVSRGPEPGVNQWTRGISQLEEVLWGSWTHPIHRALVEQLLPAGRALQALSSFSGISTDTCPSGGGVWEEQRPWAHLGSITGRCLAFRANALGFSVVLLFSCGVKSSRLLTGLPHTKNWGLERLPLYSSLLLKGKCSRLLDLIKEPKTFTVLLLYRWTH